MSKSNVSDGLQVFSDRQIRDANAVWENCGGYPWVTPTSISDIAERLDAFNNLPRPSDEEIGFDDDHLIQVSIQRENLDSCVTLMVSPWSQYLYSLTLNSQYILLKIHYGYNITGNNFTNSHENFHIIKEIFMTINPLFAWVDGDWDATVNGYPISNKADFPLKKPPWERLSDTIIFNRSLFDDFDFTVDLQRYEVEHWSNGITFAIENELWSD